MSLNSVSGNLPNPNTNKYGQPHYPKGEDGQKALQEGNLTYGSSFQGADGKTYYYDGVCYGPDGGAYATSHNEAFFDELCQEDIAIYLGGAFRTTSDIVNGTYEIVMPQKLTTPNR